MILQNQISEHKHVKMGGRFSIKVIAKIISGKHREKEKTSKRNFWLEKKDKG